MIIVREAEKSPLLYDSEMKQKFRNICFYLTSDRRFLLLSNTSKILQMVPSSENYTRQPYTIHTVDKAR